MKKYFLLLILFLLLFIRVFNDNKLEKKAYDTQCYTNNSINESINFNKKCITISNSDFSPQNLLNQIKNNSNFNSCKNVNSNEKTK